MKTYLLLFTILGCLSLSSCHEDEEPEADPCADSSWARVDKQGVSTCYGTAGLTYSRPNTSNATINARFYQGVVIGEAEFIEANFAIPASGVELNMAYPLIDGTYYDSEELVSGEITFISFEYSPTGDDSQCVTGTFSLTSRNANSGNTTTFTDGKFIVTGPTNTPTCNPF